MTAVVENGKHNKHLDSSTGMLLSIYEMYKN